MSRGRVSHSHCYHWQLSADPRVNTDRDEGIETGTTDRLWDEQLSPSPSLTTLHSWSNYSLTVLCPISSVERLGVPWFPQATDERILRKSPETLGNRTCGLLSQGSRAGEVHFRNPQSQHSQTVDPNVTKKLKIYAPLKLNNFLIVRFTSCGSWLL